MSSITDAATVWKSDWERSARSGAHSQLLPPIYAPSFKVSKDNADAYSDFSSSRAIDVKIQDVHGPFADLVVEYGLPYTNGASLRFKIDGEIHFVHGRHGWLDDYEWWTNRTIVGFRAASGSTTSIQSSKIVGDEEIQFELDGSAYTWNRTASGWNVVALQTPTPATAPPSISTDAPSYNASQPDATAGSNNPPVAVPAYGGSDCEEADVTAVYDDGKVLELDDGRHLRVDDSDTTTSSVWVPPFDGLICDQGDRFINKDENESVDLQS